jgi:hypothetical protein
MSFNQPIEEVGAQVGAYLVKEYQKAINEHSASSDAVRIECGLEAMSRMLVFLKRQIAENGHPQK